MKEDDAKFLEITREQLNRDRDVLKVAAGKARFYMVAALIIAASALITGSSLLIPVAMAILFHASTASLLHRLVASGTEAAYAGRHFALKGLIMIVVMCLTSVALPAMGTLPLMITLMSADFVPAALTCISIAVLAGFWLTFRIARFAIVRLSRQLKVAEVVRNNLIKGHQMIVA